MSGTSSTGTALTCCGTTSSGRTPGKHDPSLGLAELFRYYYERVPEGVVNGRWGNTHWDFRTSEYQARLDHETGGAWEKNRGIGLSFG
jgi:alpha-L-fucosidase